MRSITLGGALVDEGAEVVLVTRVLPAALAARAAAHGLEVDDLGPAAGDAGCEPGTEWATIERHDPVAVVIDGYHLGDLVTAGHGVPVTIIDDNGELPLAGVDRVVNQNLHADPAMYDTGDHAIELLLGAPHALLRRDVIALAGTREPVADSVLVAFGGADPASLTEPVCRVLLARSTHRLHIGVGPANRARPRLEEMVAGADPDRAGLCDPDLVDGLRAADLAVIGGGTALWEVGYLGIPTVAVVVADNQVAGTRAAARAGFVVEVDGREPAATDRIVDALLGLADDRVRRGAMTAAGQALFDGRGAARVAHAVLA